MSNHFEESFSKAYKMNSGIFQTTYFKCSSLEVATFFLISQSEQRNQSFH